MPSDNIDSWFAPLWGAISGRLLEKTSHEPIHLRVEVPPNQEPYEVAVWVQPNILVEADTGEVTVRVPPFRLDLLGLQEAFDDVQSLHVAQLLNPVFPGGQLSGIDQGGRVVLVGRYHSTRVRLLLMTETKTDEFGLVVRYRGDEILNFCDFDPSLHGELVV